MREWICKLNHHWFNYELHSIETQLANQACNNVRRVTQTLQLNSSIIVVELFGIKLERVTKTLQPSSTPFYTL
jgi:hypothetical protein